MRGLRGRDADLGADGLDLVDVLWALRCWARLDDSDFRKNHPRFTGENLQRNVRLADQVQAIADQVGVTSAQVALAWLLAQGDDILPIPGTKRVNRVEENVTADTVTLTAEQIAALTALPVAEGGHHADEQMRFIER
ncbi:aldo/keto reductase [Micromonospora sp. NPDC048839]|uniref:aldo/keto reductase n=1 Tax=Micromonospora sp. NPDC048839 TaxID=3155641 RepID=UPI0033C015A6